MLSTGCLQDRNVFIGLYKGISGILYLLSRAKKAGIHIDPHNDILQANWTFLHDRYLDFALDAPSGLFNEKTGVAVALTAALDAGLSKRIRNILPAWRICYMIFLKG